MNKYIGVARSEIGFSHKKRGRECQDSSGILSGAKYTAVIVSDGHGGDKHFRSKMGSSLIKEVVEASIQDFAKSVYKQSDRHDAEDILRWYEKYLIFAWREEIASELLIDPIEQDKRILALSKNEAEEVLKDPHIAYGATMLLAIFCGKFLFLSQLGDGDIRILTRKGVDNPIQEDGQLKFGRTASLCNVDALSHIRRVVIPSAAVSGCFLSSDGVKNSFDSDENYNRFVKTLLNGMAEDKNAISNELKDFLPVLSKNGSGDDVSIAAIIKQ